MRAYGCGVSFGGDRSALELESGDGYAEVEVFLELSCFFDDPVDVGNLISGSSAFSKTSLNIRKFMVHVLLKPAWRILSITLLACEMSAICTITKVTFY